MATRINHPNDDRDYDIDVAEPEEWDEDVKGWNEVLEDAAADPSLYPELGPQNEPPVADKPSQQAHSKADHRHVQDPQPAKDAPITFKEIAGAMIKRGIPVIPVPPREKGTCLKNWPARATTDPKQIAKWNRENPAYNCGAVAKPNGNWILDCDDPELPTRIEVETGHKIPETFTVKSGKGRPHFYFAQTDASRSMGNVSVSGIFDAQVNNKYVVAPGSTHPNGNRYEVVRDAEIIPAPDWLVQWISQQKKTRPTQQQKKTHPAQQPDAGADGEKILEGGRDNFLFEQAWRLRNAGLSQDDATAALLVINRSRCEPPMTESEVRQKIKSAFTREPRLRHQAATANTNQPPTPAARELVIETAAEIEPELITWIWDGRVPFGKITIFTGNPDVGKSLVSLDVVARASTGQDFADQKNHSEPIDVLMLIAEDDLGDTVVPRLKAAGADLKRVHFLTSVVTTTPRTRDERAFALDADIQALKEKLKASPEIKLIVIDPLSNYLGRADMNKEQQVRQVLTPLKQVVGETGCAMIGIMHFNKNIAVSSIQKTGGAIGLVGLPRMVWGFAKALDDDDLRLMMRVKGNISKEFKNGLQYRIVDASVEISGKTATVPVIKWEGVTTETVDQVLAASNDPEESKLRKAMKWLRDFILADGGEVYAKDAYKAAEKEGIKEATLRRASYQLGVKRSRDGGNGPWFWSLPTEEDEDASAAKDQETDTADPLDTL
jgi:hypothetical protein